METSLIETTSVLASVFGSNFHPTVRTAHRIYATQLRFWLQFWRRRLRPDGPHGAPDRRIASPPNHLVGSTPPQASTIAPSPRPLCAPRKMSDRPNRTTRAANTYSVVHRKLIGPSSRQAAHAAAAACGRLAIRPRCLPHESAAGTFSPFSNRQLSGHRGRGRVACWGGEVILAQPQRHLSPPLRAVVFLVSPRFTRGAAAAVASQPADRGRSPTVSLGWPPDQRSAVAGPGCGDMGVPSPW
jgi:hypothetical protein